MASSGGSLQRNALTPRGRGWLKLPLAFPAAEFNEELRSVLPLTRPQIDNEKWRGLVLHGLGIDRPRPAHTYGYADERTAPYRWTEAADHCPRVRSFIEDNMPCDALGRVKLNVLEPGGSVHPHRDASPGAALGVSDRSSPADYLYLTLVIRWPDEAKFFVGNERIPLADGDAFLLNFAEEHEVRNESSEARLTLTVTGPFQDATWFRSLLDNAEAAP